MVVSLGQAMGIEKVGAEKDSLLLWVDRPTQELLREFVSFVDGSLFAFGLGEDHLPLLLVS